MRQHPEDPFPRYGLAMEYKNSGRLAESWQVFEELMARNPDYTAAYLHAGGVLVSLGEIERARSVFERGITVCRSRRDGHTLGELEGALADLPPPPSPPQPPPRP